MKDLSILIPARNEMFLGRTIQDILENIEGNTEIIVVLDSYKPDPPLIADPRVTLIYHPESIGQRAAANEAARLSRAKYLMKCDAHCSFEKGFDIKMINDMHDDWTMVPLMKNLHAFDWMCEEGHRRYQGPSGPCIVCGKDTQRDICWIAKDSPKSVSYCFDSTPHFQYFGEYAKRPEGQGDITETMSLQGSCWMLTRDKYWELEVCEENFGSWGSQGIEVAVKTWLSGGSVMVNHKTWYAHMFRTQGGDFGFPYPMSGSQQERAKKYARDLFFNGKWPQQTRPLSWLVEKFWPVKGWTEEDLEKLKANTFLFSNKAASSKTAESEPINDIPTKGIIYYTDSELDEKIAKPVRDQLLKISQEKNIPIVSASLKKMDFGVKSIHFPSLKRGYLTMTKQIIAALEHSSADIIFFCEHDVLYHPSHFDFTPPDKNTFYYNQNVWFLRISDGHALHYDVNQLSGLCGYRPALLTHYRERYSLIEKEGFSRNIGFEPMTHHRVKWKNIYKLGTWKSPFPNIDIRHPGNATGQRWKKEQYRNQRLLINWTESDINHIPGWENLDTMFADLKFLDKSGRPNSVYPATKYLTNGPWIYMVPQFKPKDVLMLGFAGGTVAGLIKLIYGNVPITAVDIEKCPNFYGVELIQADAREYVKTSKHFDVVIVDLLYDISDAYEFVLGKEFVGNLKRIANYVIVHTGSETDMKEYEKAFGHFGSNKPNRLSNRIYYYGTDDYNHLIIK